MNNKSGRHAPAHTRAIDLRNARELIARSGVPGDALDRLLGRIDMQIVAVLDDQPENRVCSACHSPFSLTPDERRFYDDRGWGYPKRCLTCRRHRRTEEHVRIEHEQAPPQV